MAENPMIQNFNDGNLKNYRSLS